MTIEQPGSKMSGFGSAAVVAILVCDCIIRQLRGVFLMNQEYRPPHIVLPECMMVMLGFAAITANLRGFIAQPCRYGCWWQRSTRAM